MYTMPFWLKKHRLHFLFPPAAPKKGSVTWVAPKLAKSLLELEDEACGGFVDFVIFDLFFFPRCSNGF